MAELIVAFPKAEDARSIKNILVRNGFFVNSTATTGSAVLNLAGNIGRGIIVCAYQFSDMVYRDLKEDLSDEFDVLLICNPARLSEPVSQDVVFLPLPLKVHDLIDTVAMMDKCLLKRQSKKRLTPPVRSNEDKAVLAKAKTLLMERNNMSENDAHRYLQKCSMENGCNLVETALMVISLNRD